MIIKLLKLNSKAITPIYATSGSAGFDFHSVRDVFVPAGATVLVETGLSLEIPVGYELQVRPRSGMSAKTKIRVSNSPGTVDSDYRGEIKIIIDNIGKEGYEIKTGDRIAQGIVAPVVQVTFQEVTDLEETDRGMGGFGSSGI